MAAPGRLLSLGAAVLCVTPRIGPAESFVASPCAPFSSGTTSFFGERATCSRRSRCVPRRGGQELYWLAPRPVCRSSEIETSDQGAIGERGRDLRQDLSSPTARRGQITRDGSDGSEVVSSQGGLMLGMMWMFWSTTQSTHRSKYECEHDEEKVHNYSLCC